MKNIITKWKESGLLSMIIWCMVAIVVIWLPINFWVKWAISTVCLIKFAGACLRYFIIKDDRKNNKSE